MPEYSEPEVFFSIRELKKMASEAGIKNYGYMRKSELNNALGFSSLSKTKLEMVLEAIFILVVVELFWLIISMIIGFILTLAGLSLLGSSLLIFLVLNLLAIWSFVDRDKS